MVRRRLGGGVTWPPRCDPIQPPIHANRRIRQGCKDWQASSITRSIPLVKVLNRMLLSRRGFCEERRREHCNQNLSWTGISYRKYCLIAEPTLPDPQKRMDIWLHGHSSYTAIIWWLNPYKISQGCREQYGIKVEKACSTWVSSYPKATEHSPTVLSLRSDDNEIGSLA